MMKLEDLLPPKPEAKINGKVYTFRSPNLGDDVWIKQNIGGADELKSMVNKLDWLNIAKLAYHLMGEDGRRDFKARKAIIISESTGDEVERFFTGPEVLLHHLTGVESGVSVLGAITRAMANSNPMIGDLVKKSLEEAKAAVKAADPIGGKSLTHSPVNTKSRKRNSKR